MAEVQRAQWTGLVVPDPRAQVWESECVGNPAAPIVGQPVPDDPNLVGEPGLRCRYYERDGVRNTVTLSIQAPGVPYQTGSGQPASVVGQEASGVTQRWMPPWVGTHSERALSAGYVQIHDWSVDSWDSETTWGAVLVELTTGVYEVELLWWPGALGDVERRDFDSFRGMGSGAKIAVLAGEESAIVLVVDGATLIVAEGDAFTRDGATSTRWLPLTSTPDTIVKASAARRGQEAVLFLTAAERTYHLASFDGGYSWQYQGQSAGAYVEDVCASAAGFHVLWWSEDDRVSASIANMRHSRMAAAASPWAVAEYSTVTTLTSAAWSAGAITGRGVGITATEDQRLVVVDQEGLITTSDDLGASWQWDAGLVGAFGGHTMRVWSLDTPPAKVALAHRLGRVISVTTAPSGGNDGAVRVDYLGGWWASSTHPILYDAPQTPTETRTARPSSLVRWLPFEAPSAAWASSASGAGSETLQNGYMRLSGGIRTYIGPAFGVVPSLAYRAPRTLYAEFSTGGTYTAPTANGAVRLQTKYYDGAGSRIVRVTVTSTTLEIYEDTTGAGVWTQLDTVTHGLDISDPCWVSATFLPADVASSSNVYIIARAGAVQPEWGESVTVTAISTYNPLTPSTTNNVSIQWGSGTADIDVYTMGYAVTTAALPDRAIAKETMDAYTPGRPLSPFGVYVHNGITVEPTPGVATMSAGRSWTIATDYLYPRSAVLDPSPRTKWQAPSNDGTHKIAIQLDALGKGSMGSTLGVWIGGAMLPGLTVETHDGVAWNSVALTQPLTTGIGWDRFGETVTLDGAGSAAPLVRQSEFDGAAFSVGGTAFRRISRTFAGKARNGDRMTATLVLEDVEGTDATSGTTGGIIPRDMLLLLDVSIGVRGVRIGTDTTKAGPLTVECGRIMVGRAMPIPDDPDWQWSVTTASRTTSEETRDGERRVRRDGPGYRVVQVAWQSGVDTLGAVDDTDDPDWFHIGQDLGDAMLGTTPQTMEGIYRMQDGDGEQVVLVLRATSTDAAGSGQALIRRHQAVFGRLNAELRQDAELGSGEAYIWRFDATVTEER